MAGPSDSVVILARDAARTLGRVLDAPAAREPAPLEVIVIADASQDETAALATELGARVLATGGGHFACGARNEHERRTVGDLRRQQRRLASGPAGAAPLEDGALRRTLRRVPLHCFALLRLPVVYPRVQDPRRRLRPRILAVLPRLVLAESTLGASAVHYAAPPPALCGGAQPIFE